MKVIMISGSRNPKGQTARAGNALLDGVSNAGCNTEQIYLPALEIERCIQCEENGWGSGIQDKPVMGICVAGGGGGGGALSCCLSLEKVLNGCGFDVLDMAPVKRQNLKAKLNNLRLNGAWLTTVVNTIPEVH